MTAVLPGLPTPEAARTVAGMTPSARGRNRARLAQRTHHVLAFATRIAAANAKASISRLRRHGLRPNRYRRAMRVEDLAQ